MAALEGLWEYLIWECWREDLGTILSEDTVYMGA